MIQQFGSETGLVQQKLKNSSLQNSTMATAVFDQEMVAILAEMTSDS